MPTQNNRTHRGKSKQQRLKPRENTLSQWTRKEEMLQGFHRSPTKARERNWQPERPKTALYRGHREQPSNTGCTPDDPDQKRKGNTKWPANQEHHRPQQTSPHNEERPYFRTKGISNRPWYSNSTRGNRHERKTHHRLGHHETPKKTHPDCAKQEGETYRRVERPWGYKNTAGKKSQGGKHQNED